LFGAGSNNAAFQDVPIQDNGFQVFINRAFVVNDSLEIARARAGLESIVAQSMAEASFEAASGSTQNSSGLSSIAVPEPATSALALAGLLGIGALTLRLRA